MKRRTFAIIAPYPVKYFLFSVTRISSSLFLCFQPTSSRTRAHFNRFNQMLNLFFGMLIQSDGVHSSSLVDEMLNSICLIFRFSCNSHFRLQTKKNKAPSLFFLCFLNRSSSSSSSSSDTVAAAATRKSKEGERCLDLAKRKIATLVVMMKAWNPSAAGRRM